MVVLPRTTTTKHTKHLANIEYILSPKAKISCNMLTLLKNKLDYALSIQLIV